MNFPGKEGDILPVVCRFSSHLRILACPSWSPALIIRNLPSQCPESHKPVPSNKSLMYISYSFLLWLNFLYTQCFKAPLLSLRVCVSHSVVSDSLWPIDCSSPSFSVHGILQARILDMTSPFPSPGGWSQPRGWIQVSCITDRFFVIWAIRGAPLTAPKTSIIRK